MASWRDVMLLANVFKCPGGALRESRDLRQVAIVQDEPGVISRHLSWVEGRVVVKKVFVV